MRWFRFAAIVLVAAILQASLLNIIALPPLNIKPNILLIFLVFYAIHYNTTEAIITSFAIGFVADISSGAPMGTQTISYGLFGTSLAYLHRVITIRSMPSQAFAIFITGCLVGVLTHSLALLKGQSTISNIYTAILGIALYSAIIGPLFFLPAAWFMGIKTNRFGRH